ncbi:RNA helicase Mov10l1-like [Cydia strobilella]|uniref:RNA helicase Mov10l1-like n=1 Tax=Cydia strobilella TaxID=1100964 RepID=UPI0030077B54
MQSFKISCGNKFDSSILTNKIMQDSQYCDFCGVVDEVYEEHSELDHEDTPKHICNRILHQYKHKKKEFSRNRDGVIILGAANSLPLAGSDARVIKEPPTDHHKVRIFAKPNQEVEFFYTITNDMKSEDLLVVGIQLAHPQPHFVMCDHDFIFGQDPHLLEPSELKFFFKITNDMKSEDLLVIGIQLAHPQPHFVMCDHDFIFGQDPHLLEPKSTIDTISITFVGADVGQYEMPIMFTFIRNSDGKSLIFIREMVVLVATERPQKFNAKSPYSNLDWKHAERFVVSTDHVPYNNLYKIPKLLKILLPAGLDEDALEKIEGQVEFKMQLRNVLLTTRAIFDEGITKANYMLYFHHLLWWEEIIARINLRKYNMTAVTLEKKGDVYLLEVPGLAENRPSLLRGDKVYIKLNNSNEILFESVIKDMEESTIHIGNIDESFNAYYSPEALFDIRFMMSRVPHERAHVAVANVFERKQDSRLFPEPRKKDVKLKSIYQWYNPLIRNNEEQRLAVQHILSGTSRRAPYMVHGPPGTGKTMTIVEAIIQIVQYSSKNRVMVCTDSNMAADHIALMLLKYNKELNINNFILRANSQTRVWSVMPSELAPVSNGTKYENSYSVSNYALSSYRVVVTTLLHAAKYGTPRAQAQHKLQMSHLFIDEAAQASEPATLVPVTGLLAPAGMLVLAGDPMQLGPVCISRDAKDRGLGKSLMERLKTDYANLYESDPNYITMLVKNFRNDPDILSLPNNMFYDDNLVPLAPEDPLSRRSILGLPGGERAVVFHAVNSREQRMGKAPSFFNEKELDMLKRYTKALIEQHNVKPADIGVIAPYIRQVYKMKTWLMSAGYDEIEVGTVEAFQGKEKRVILVSTVRANCRLLDYDAKYGLGFLVDDKRFNVTLTRAKSKLVIIGNPTCLTRDKKWRRYMTHCKDLNCYFGHECEQIERTSKVLNEVAITRFNKCRISAQLKPNPQHEKEKKK